MHAEVQKNIPAAKLKVPAAAKKSTSVQNQYRKIPPSCLDLLGTKASDCFRTRGFQSLDVVLNRLAIMNDTVQEVYRRLSEQRLQTAAASRDAGGATSRDVERRMRDFRNQQLHTDDRVSKLEVKVRTTRPEKSVTPQQTTQIEQRHIAVLL